MLLIYLDHEWTHLYSLADSYSSYIYIMSDYYMSMSSSAAGHKLQCWGCSHVTPRAHQRPYSCTLHYRWTSSGAGADWDAAWYCMNVAGAASLAEAERLVKRIRWRAVCRLIHTHCHIDVVFSPSVQYVTIVIALWDAGWSVAHGAALRFIISEVWAAAVTERASGV